MKARETLSPLRIVIMILITALFMLWLVIPFMLTVLWSLVDKTHPWAWPDALPPVLSLGRWVEVWTTTALPQALRNSYLLAATVSVCTLMLSLPAAWAFGRMSFTGKHLLQNAILLPLIVPGFVVALFFSMLLNVAGIHSRFGGILLGHIIILMPYAVRILTLSFSQIRQDTLDAARDMGASVINRFLVACLPTIRPGIFAALIIVFTLSIEEFAISFIVGSPDFITVPTILYSYLGYNFIRPNAAVISLMLVVPNVMLMLIAEKLLTKNPVASFAGKG
ncbi:ABC transporter permease [Pantoea ananatis]|uniref:ABC transporter permease n=1 Tax=Pantoea ananas TaxID=553 RepID=UPI001576EE53|nr:ABC transporter permease [Pantoea ananatis]NQE80743.1 spermidine/putrescine ABC transporter permease [Pantoea ananatis]NQE85208.1 spermidine/putrescine ABC transporter permease [Pantoea ananatis]